jgi:hypothetical protein
MHQALCAPKTAFSFMFLEVLGGREITRHLITSSTPYKGPAKVGTHQPDRRLSLATRRAPSKSQAETTSEPTASSQICLLAYNFTAGGVTPIGHRRHDLRYGIVTYLLTSRGYVRYENLPAHSQIAELAVKDEIAICLASFSPLWRKAGEIAL